MKKIFYFATLAFLAMGMASCNDDKDNPTPNPGPDDGGSVELVTGEYTIEGYAAATDGSVQPTPFTMLLEKDGTSYTIDQWFGISGMPLIFTYENGTLTSLGYFMSQGQMTELFGYYYGAVNPDGTITSAFAVLSYLDAENIGQGADPIMISVDPEQNTLSQLATNISLIMAPATLNGNSLTVDEQNAYEAAALVAGSSFTKGSAMASLSSVRRAPVKIAPIAPVKATQSLR